MALAEDYGILDKVGIKVDRAAVAQTRLEAIRKASLARRLSVKAGEFNPLTLVSSLFTHVDRLHFGFNVWIFLLVGSLMEGYWGTRTFLGLFTAGGEGLKARRKRKTGWQS